MSEIPFLSGALGTTGRKVHRLGIASSFGIGGSDLEAAVEEHGVNYLYWGSLRTRAFRDAIRALCARGRRDELFVVIQSYSRVASLVRPSLTRALRQLGIEQADLLLLGWWNGPVWSGVRDAAVRCQEQGLVRHLGVSTHERRMVSSFAAPESPFAVVHVRYNAAHRGAESDVFPFLGTCRAGLVAFTATCWRKLITPVRGAPADLPVPTAGDCYRFALQRPELDVCLAGPRHGADLQAALAAVAKGPMTDDELAWLRRYGDLVYGR